MEDSNTGRIEDRDNGEVSVVFLGDVDVDNIDNNNVQIGDNDGEEEIIIVNDNDTTTRLGTTSSARFNILATMVGGGSLSLPLAFAKSGNVLMGPILLVVMAVISEYCFRIMVQTIRVLSYKNVDLSASTTKVGRDSFESMTAAAFGPKAYVASMGLVTCMCFFAMVAYAVLLRDILEPITGIIYGPQVPGPSWRNNSLLWVVVLVVTPLCTLRTLTSLKRFGAASMYSVFILGCCVLFRSVQCNLAESTHNNTWQHWTDSFRLWPERWWDLLDVFPLYISCYVCHYNIPTVHNELRRPSVARVSWWLRSTTWVATLFYMFMGIAGSAYGAKCTATGHVQGNILLDFRNSDPLLSIGRTCLAITISVAFPMLTIPARDIVLRSLDSYLASRRTARPRPLLNDAFADDDITNPRATSREPLLSTTANDDEIGEEAPLHPNRERGDAEPAIAADAPLWLRLVVSIALLWTATSVASIVDSIDTVWDLLGSSLSIFLSILIPAGSFLIVTEREQQRTQGQEDGQADTALDATTTTIRTDVLEDTMLEEIDSLYTWSASIQHLVSRFVARSLIAVFIPLMFLSMGNAVHHTFFEHKEA